jgi:hypothetical protein
MRSGLVSFLGQTPEQKALRTSAYGTAETDASMIIDFRPQRASRDPGTGLQLRSNLPSQSATDPRRSAVYL